MWLKEKRSHTKIWKLDRILDKENWNIIPHDIPDSFISKNLDREPAHIPHSIRTASTSLNSGKTHKHRCISRCVCQDPSMAQAFNTLVQFEVSKCPGATGMDDSLGDAFMVESGDLESIEYTV